MAQFVVAEPESGSLSPFSGNANHLPHAKVAELADAQDSGSCGVTPVGVQLPPFALPHSCAQGCVVDEEPNCDSTRTSAMSTNVLAGVDAAYDSNLGLTLAAAVVWDPRSGGVVEHHVALARTPAPYVPGRFAEREAGVSVAALRALKIRPAAVLCDAHGRAHPRQWGLACELARATGWPTVGCAKSLLCGQHGAVAPVRGAWADIELEGEIVGRVLRTQENVRPVYVSVGGYIELDTAMHTVLQAAPHFRLPEPLRLAHRYARAALTMVLARLRTAE